MLQRLLPDSLGMLLHHQLYTRMVAFGKLYTPEFPIEPVVTTWLQRFYNSDPRIHILINLSSEMLITAHAILEIQEAYSTRVISCYQAQHDRNDRAIIDQGFEYMHKLRDEVGAHCVVINAGKHTKAYQKQYGYRIARTVLINYISNDDINEDIDNG